MSLYMPDSILSFYSMGVGERRLDLPQIPMMRWRIVFFGWAFSLVVEFSTTGTFSTRASAAASPITKWVIHCCGGPAALTAPKVSRSCLVTSAPSHHEVL